MQAKEMIKKIKEEITRNIWVDKTNSKLNCDVLQVLYHELGHLEQALELNFTFVSLRIKQWFIVPDPVYGYLVFDIETLARDNSDIKEYYANVKNSGECYMYTDNVNDTSKLQRDYISMLEGGPQGTANLAQADKMQESPKFLQNVKMFNYHEKNPIEDQHPCRFQLKRLDRYNNDQKRMIAIRKDPNEAVKLNNCFKRVAKSETTDSDTWNDKLHSAVLKHIKNPSK